MPFVGLDLANAEDIMERSTISSVVERAKELWAEALVIRDGFHAPEVEKQRASFDEHTSTYSPSRLIFRTRVAFVVTANAKRSVK